jgi:hypothetical protein
MDQEINGERSIDREHMRTFRSRRANDSSLFVNRTRSASRGVN